MVRCSRLLTTRRCKQNQRSVQSTDQVLEKAIDHKIIPSFSQQGKCDT